MRLYPDAADIPRNIMIIRVDSGPGHTNYKWLAKICVEGLYLYPCVPNTTAMIQEID